MPWQLPPPAAAQLLTAFCDASPANARPIPGCHAGGVQRTAQDFALHRLVLHRPAPPTACPATPHQPVPLKSPSPPWRRRALAAAAPEQLCTLWVGAMGPQALGTPCCHAQCHQAPGLYLFDPHVHPPAGQLPQAAFVVRLFKPLIASATPAPGLKRCAWLCVPS